MDETLQILDASRAARAAAQLPFSSTEAAYRHLADEARREVRDPYKLDALLHQLDSAYAILADNKERAQPVDLPERLPPAAPSRTRPAERRRAGARPAPGLVPARARPAVEAAFRALLRVIPAGTPADLLERARTVLVAPVAPLRQDTSGSRATPAGAEPPVDESDLRAEFLREFGRSSEPPDGRRDRGRFERPYAPSRDGGDTLTIERLAPSMEPPLVSPGEPPAAGPVLRPEEGLARDVLVRHSILPVRRENGTLELAVSRQEDIEAAEALAQGVGARGLVKIIDRSAVHAGLIELYREEDQREIARGHAEREPQMSAQRAFTKAQVAGAVLALGGILVSAFFFLAPTLIALVAACTVFYLGSSAYKMFIVFMSLKSPGEVPIDEDDVYALDERTLPVYTLLLPLYREANVVEHLLTGIDGLDYPADKLDVKLLLEPDDTETLAAIERAHLPPYYQKLIVPTGGPKAKPKALNYGLLHARGEYCTIYDAEDRPEPDQLKKAVIAFRKSGDDVGCVQAKLNFYNPDQNLLTRWFTADYSQWFDLYLPGLTGAGAPIPLGGTSNHFPTSLLRRIGGWDPYNVTEDADLGIRLARGGQRTVMIDSVTYEEANSKLGNWLRQRSHWIKGYMLTWLVHMRNPFKLWRELGTHGFFSIQMTVAGSVFGYFANPVFWALIIAWYTLHWSAIQILYPAPVLYMSIVALFGANFVFIYVAMAGCVRRGFYEGVKYALIIPVYWALMTVSAVHALYQLVVKPHYWEKTVHGLGRRAVPETLVAKPVIAE